MCLYLLLNSTNYENTKKKFKTMLKFRLKIQNY